MTPCYTKSWNRDFPHLVQTMYVYLSSLRPTSSKSPDELCARDATGLHQSPTLQASLRSSLSTTMKRANFRVHFRRILCLEEAAAISSLSPARSEGRDGDDILCNARYNFLGPYEIIVQSQISNFATTQSAELLAYVNQ